MTPWMEFKQDIEEEEFDGPYAEWLESRLAVRLHERDEARAMVAELVEYIGLTTEIVPGSFAHNLLAKAEALHG